MNGWNMNYLNEKSNFEQNKTRILLLCKSYTHLCHNLHVNHCPVMSKWLNRSK